MGHIPRNTESVLRRLIGQSGPNRDVILVEGARQAGKTTLVEHVINSLNQKKICINLGRDRLMRHKIDECREFRDFQALLRLEHDFDPTAGTILFIDESQESRMLGGFVRFMKEEWPNAVVVLSGSTLTRLFRDDTRFPVDRVRRLTVTPLTFEEFLEATGRQALRDALGADALPVPAPVHAALLQKLDTYLAVGGMPRVVLDMAEGKDWRERMRSIVADYEADFVRLFGEEERAIAMACFRSAANFVGSPSKNTTVVPSLTHKIHHMVNSVFARLEAWKLVLRSDQRGLHPEQRHGYHPKRYLFDTGLLRHFREVGAPAIAALQTTTPEIRATLGGIIENQVAIELARRGEALSGWRKTPSGMEIDFVVHRGPTPFPIECKASLQIKKTHAKGIKEYLSLYELPLGATVSMAPLDVLDVGPGMRVVNVPLYHIERLDAIMEWARPGLGAGERGPAGRHREGSDWGRP